MAPRLGPQEVEARLLGLRGWSVVDGQRLEKSYRFPDFASALAFVNRLGAAAEAQGHHPDVYLAWGRVRLQLWTHDAGGLTERDFVLAARADELGPGAASEP